MKVINTGTSGAECIQAEFNVRFLHITEADGGRIIELMQECSLIDEMYTCLPQNVLKVFTVYFC